MAFAVQGNIPDHYKIKYSDQWETVIQQEMAKFEARGQILSDWVEKQYVATDLEKTDWQFDDSRFGETNPTEAGNGGWRSGFKRKARVAKKFDQWDDKFLSTLGLPDSAVIRSMKMGWNRIKDTMFLDAAGADALGGPHPHTTPQVFPTGNVIPVDYKYTGTPANIGLTPHKLLRVQELALKADVDIFNEDVYLAISPRQYTDMIVYSETYATDTWAKVVSKWLENPTQKLMGFTPIISNRLTLDSATDIRTCVAFSDRAMKVAPLDMRTHMDVLAGQKHALQIAHYALWGVYRHHDELVWKVQCDESP